MPDPLSVRTFSAHSGAGPRPWRVLWVALPVLVVAFYLLGPLIGGAVAAVTLLVAVPLALRHRRVESTSEVDVSADAVIHRRGGSELQRLDRRSSAFEAVVFTDRYALRPQLLLTDGSRHVRLVAGQWQPATLDELAVAVSDGVPKVASWQEVKADHRSALPWWERHTTAIIAGTVLGLPVLGVLGAVLAVLLFDVG